MIATADKSIPDNAWIDDENVLNFFEIYSTEPEQNVVMNSKAIMNLVFEFAI